MSPCEHVKIGGADVIVCSRGRRQKKPCRWCRRPATKLCDHPVAAGKTCDAPLCYIHATRVGDNLDACPDHAEKPRQGGLF